METVLNFKILPQPNATTCGPTCLQALYAYYKDEVPMDRVIREVPELTEGGTFAVFLACHALRRGYDATIYTYNIQAFDPTWFRKNDVDIRERLKSQMKEKDEKKLHIATKGYLEFFDMGGKLRFEDLTVGLVRKFLTRSKPIITGLSATYLYRSMREVGAEGKDDDARGEPTGHFVVLCGYDRQTRNVLIADPLDPNPLSDRQRYLVPIDRVIGAIFLGILTYDANLLIIEPKRKRGYAVSHRRQ